MDLNDSQKAIIAGWVAEGLRLSDIQSKIKEEFEISLTYMDARFLIDDLELQLKDQPKPVDKDLRNAPPPEPAPDATVEEMEPSMEGSGGVSVSLDRLYKPGAIVSGGVVFSDGQSAEWALDQMGRLTLQTATEGYQPEETDLQDFQHKLGVLLQKQGL